MTLAMRKGIRFMTSDCHRHTTFHPNSHRKRFEFQDNFDQKRGDQIKYSSETTIEAEEEGNRVGEIGQISLEISAK